MAARPSFRQMLLTLNMHARISDPEEKPSGRWSCHVSTETGVFVGTDSTKRGAIAKACSKALESDYGALQTAEEAYRRCLETQVLEDKAAAKEKRYGSADASVESVVSVETEERCKRSLAASAEWRAFTLDCTRAWKIPSPLREVAARLLQGMGFESVYRSRGGNNQFLPQPNLQIDIVGYEAEDEESDEEEPENDEVGWHSAELAPVVERLQAKVQMYRRCRTPPRAHVILFEVGSERFSAISAVGTCFKRASQLLWHVVYYGALRVVKAQHFSCSACGKRLWSEDFCNHRDLWVHTKCCPDSVDAEQSISALQKVVTLDAVTEMLTSVVACVGIFLSDARLCEMFDITLQAEVFALLKTLNCRSCIIPQPFSDVVHSAGAVCATMEHGLRKSKIQSRAATLQFGTILTHF